MNKRMIVIPGEDVDGRRFEEMEKDIKEEERRFRVHPEELSCNLRTSLERGLYEKTVAFILRLSSALYQSVPEGMEDSSSFYPGLGLKVIGECLNRKEKCRITIDYDPAEHSVVFNREAEED